MLTRVDEIALCRDQLWTPFGVRPCGTHDAEIRAFVQALIDDTPVLVPGEQALMVTQILDALYESSEAGREVLL